MNGNLAAVGPAATESYHGHNHSYSYTRAKHTRGGARIPPPFVMPRIPSEMIMATEDGEREHGVQEDNARAFAQNQSLAPPNSSLSFSNHRRHHPHSLEPTPNLSVNGHTNRSKSMDTTTILPVQMPSATLSDGHMHSGVSRQEKKQASDSETSLVSSSVAAEALSAVLLVLPFILVDCLEPLKLSKLNNGSNEKSYIQSHMETSGHEALLTTFFVTFITLLLVGAYGKYTQAIKSDGAEPSHTSPSLRIDTAFLLQTVTKIAAIGLPIFASQNLGGLLTGLVFVVLAAAGLLPVDHLNYSLRRLDGWKRLLVSKATTISLLVASTIFAVTWRGPLGLSTAFGAIALLLSITLVTPPFLKSTAPPVSIVSPPRSAKSISAVPLSPWDIVKSSSSTWATSPLISSSHAIDSTLLAAASTGVIAASLSYMNGSVVMWSSVNLGSCGVAVATVFTLLSCAPYRQRSSHKVGLIVGLLTSTTCSVVLSWTYLKPVHLAIISVAAYVAVQFDDGEIGHTTASALSLFKHEHEHTVSDEKSSVTLFLLRLAEGHPGWYILLSDKNSRGIFFFMCLNFAFMLVQLTYAFVTDSLGLMSDSIHMFFDCLALAVGLYANVLSKHPPSMRFPYGYGKVDSLAGFGNGIFLMIISIEIIYEAVERLYEGHGVSNLLELGVVSFLGLLVNVVGLMSFEHGHTHGDEGDDIGHAHGHAHTGGAAASDRKKKSHNHGSENLYGIYLHIVADIMGSIAVVISTILTGVFGWPGFDPLGSCAIAILIFASAIPLVTTSAKSLLLALPDKVEYTLRDTLSDLLSIRGIIGYTVPKFWLEDKVKKVEAHGHHHHDHDEHDHSHSHVHGHDHSHQEHNHDHEHEHQHEQNHDGGHEHHHDHHNPDNHDHSHDHQHSHPSHSRPNPREEEDNRPRKILGVVHIIASRGADLHDLRSRINAFMVDRNMDLVIQLEREGDGRCWCGSGLKSS